VTEKNASNIDKIALLCRLKNSAGMLIFVWMKKAGPRDGPEIAWTDAETDFWTLYRPSYAGKGDGGGRFYCADLELEGE
jgi:hypothetical protein